MLGPPSRLSPQLLGSGLCPDHSQGPIPQRSLPSTLPVLIAPPPKKAVPVNLSSSGVTTDGTYLPIQSLHAAGRAQALPRSGEGPDA